ncbi:MAG: F0F1 ATP synthase subunit A [Oscillospiraceae bacterium]|nr:F0F1 ATP synthase subunit A [Oscillospiraceae bacterium]
MNISISEVTSGFSVFGFEITNTMIWTWLILAILSVVFIWLGSGLKVKPTSKKQVVAEMIYGVIGNLVESNIGPNTKAFIPYFTALFAFILTANLSGVWGLGVIRPPTADVATPFALALMTCVISWYYKIKMNGIKEHLKGFLGPVKFMTPIMLPMNIISEIANPVSLTLRMFGNLLGGLIIGTLIYSMLIGSNVMPIWIALGSVLLCAVLLTKQYKKIKELDKTKKMMVMGLGILCCLPLFAMIFVHGYFDIFSGCLQTYIFCLLSMIFISP